MIRFIGIIFALIAGCLPALAQTGTPIKQSGNVTPGHAGAWTTNGILQDGGTAAIPYLTSIGTVGQGQTICAWTALSTAPGSQRLCFGVFDNAAATISLQNFGIDTPQNLNFIINGATYSFPYTVGGIVGPNSSTVGDIAVWNNVAGSLLKDVPSLQIFGTESANAVLAGPTTGSAAFPTFRALVAADIPAIPWSDITSTPTTLAGYGITNARTQISSQVFWVNSSNTNTAPCGSSGGSTCSIGNDSNDCKTALTSCRSLQHVNDLINSSYDAANTSFGVNLADTIGVTGSDPTKYDINCSRGPWIGTSVLSIAGNVGTPGNVQIQPVNSGVSGVVVNGCTIAYNGVHFIDSAGSNAAGFMQTGGGHGFGHIDISNSVIDACAACSALETDSGSSIAIGSGNSIIGNVFNPFIATGGGTFEFNGNTVAVSNNLTFNSFANANTGGQYKGVSASTFGSPTGIAGTRCNIQGPWTILNQNPNTVFPGNSDCVIQETMGAIGLQKGAGGSSTVDYGTAGYPLISGGGSAAKNSWATPSTMQAFVQPGLIYYTSTSVNFNSATTDTAIPLTNFPTGMTRFQVDRVVISNASHSLSTATMGVFATTGGSGTIAADQAITVTSTSDATVNNSMSLTLTNAATTSYVLGSLAHTPNLYARIGTPESAAATGDVTLEIRPLP